MSIVFKQKTASENQIRTHLQCCSLNFSHPLEKRISIDLYAKKIVDNAITFEAWHNAVLIGLVAAYFNDPNGDFLGYITNVSVDSEFMRQGIARTLMNECLKYAKENGINKISLEVSLNDNLALDFYKKFGFRQTENRGNFILMSVYV